LTELKGASNVRSSARQSGELPERSSVNDWAVASILFVCMFGGALLGMLLRSILPKHNFSEESKDVVRLGTGLVATMAALVLGLLVASAKGTFDVQKNGIDQLSANLILLDSALAEYGPEAQESRVTLRHIVSDALKRIWPKEESEVSTFAPATMEGSRTLYPMIQDLTPANDKQRRLQSTALQIAVELARTRWLLVAQEKSEAIPTPFLVVLVFWLAALFVSFGLFASPNPMVVGTLIVCSLSVSGALFLILELAEPFAGIIQVSSAPLRSTLALLGQ
jgi:hypothetical protein